MHRRVTQIPLGAYPYGYPEYVFKLLIINLYFSSLAGCAYVAQWPGAGPVAQRTAYPQRYPQADVDNTKKRFLLSALAPALRILQLTAQRFFRSRRGKIPA